MSIREEVHHLIDELPEEALDQLHSQLKSLRSPSSPASLDGRRSAIQRLRGSAAHLGFTTEELHRQKQEELDREEERFLRLHGDSRL